MTIQASALSDEELVTRSSKVQTDLLANTFSYGFEVTKSSTSFEAS